MHSINRTLSALIASTIGIAVMVILATVVFYIIIFVVTTGARLAGFRPSADFIVLSASIIVVAIILTGGMTPRLTESTQSDPADREHDDPTYD